MDMQDLSGRKRGELGVGDELGVKERDHRVIAVDVASEELAEQDDRQEGVELRDLAEVEGPGAGADLRSLTVPGHAERKSDRGDGTRDLATRDHEGLDPPATSSCADAVQAARHFVRPRGKARRVVGAAHAAPLVGEEVAASTCCRSSSVSQSSSATPTSCCNAFRWCAGGRVRPETQDETACCVTPSRLAISACDMRLGWKYARRFSAPGVTLLSLQRGVVVVNPAALLWANNGERMPR